MNQNLSAAVMWLEHEIVPIPAKPHSKVPSLEWRMWQNRIPPMKTVAYWFSQPSTNLAIICGGKHNLVVLDFDNEESYFEWRKKAIKRSDEWSDVAGKTYRVKTSRGMHLYTYTRQPIQSRKIIEDKIDIRSTGNITIAPPSIHPSGARYVGIGSPDKIITVDSFDSMFPVPEQAEPSYYSETNTDIFSKAISISDNTLLADLIKDKVDMLNFCSQFTVMRRTSRDGRWWMGRCIHPKHDDRNPSFRVDTATNHAVCLSPGCALYGDKGLDVIDLYERLNQVGFVQAIRELASFYLI